MPLKAGKEMQCPSVLPGTGEPWNWSGRWDCCGQGRRGGQWSEVSFLEGPGAVDHFSPLGGTPSRRMRAR